MKNPYWFLDQERYYWSVVLVFNGNPINLLFSILRLLKFENVTSKEVVNGLVGVVDAELLKTVFLKIFKSEIDNFETGIIELPLDSAVKALAYPKISKMFMHVRCGLLCDLSIGIDELPPPELL